MKSLEGKIGRSLSMLRQQAKTNKDATQLELTGSLSFQYRQSKRDGLIDPQLEPFWQSMVSREIKGVRPLVFKRPLYFAIQQAIEIASSNRRYKQRLCTFQFKEAYLSHLEQGLQDYLDFRLSLDQAQPEIHQLIERVRINHGLTRAELAGLLGVDRATVFRMETGKTAISPRTIDSLILSLNLAQSEVEALKVAQSKGY